MNAKRMFWTTITGIEYGKPFTNRDWQITYGQYLYLQDEIKKHGEVDTGDGVSVTGIGRRTTKISLN